MRVVLPIECRFYKTKDGSFWTSELYSYSFLKKYLAVFDQVLVVARAKKITDVAHRLKRVDGPGVKIVALPFYLGPLGYIKVFFELRNILKKTISENDAVILRLPSIIGSLAANFLNKRKQPFAIRVVGDPYDVFSPTAFHHFFRPFFRWLFVRNLKKECRQAVAINYITKEVLQKRYPPNRKKKQYIAIFSDVELPASAYRKKVRSYSKQKGQKFKIITIGSMEHNYKGFDLLLVAVSDCQKKNLAIQLDIIGEGKEKENLKLLAKTLKVKNVTFYGSLLHNEKFYRLLDSADLFVLPSRAEGLPRVILEAMARSLPCIATNIGGIPELLPEQDLIMPNDRVGLVTKIQEIIANPELLKKMSTRNYLFALKYQDKFRMKKQIDFYRAVKKITEKSSNNRLTN